MTTENRNKPKGEEAKTVRAKPTRQLQLAKLLNRKPGASIAQIQKAFGWQPHTARAAISTLGKLGVEIERTETVKGSIYRIAGEA